jgi:flagellar FliJ protein
MAEQSSLGRLMELARERAEAAARQLQVLSGSLRDARKQLDTLLGYRQDYVRRLEQASQAGLSASNYHNFTLFIATLDEAIAQQNKVLAQIGAQVETGRRHWSDEQRKLNSYATLAERHARRAALREQRKEQRDNDEIAAGLLRRMGKIH